MAEKIDAQIARKEAQLSPLTKIMENLKNKFIKETAIFASEWYQKTTKEYVSKYPDIMLRMNPAQITQMKAKVSGLIRDAEKMAQAELSKPILWWHQRMRMTDSIDQYLQVSDKYPE